MTRRALAALVLFLLLIPAANWTLTHVGIYAATLLAGSTFVLRDTLQEAGGRRLVVAAILGGALLSLVLSLSHWQIAFASCVAFLLSELADFAVYSRLRDAGYLPAAVASNVVGSILDTFVFLWLSPLPLTAALVGLQLCGKLTVTVVLLVVALSVPRRVSA